MKAAPAFALATMRCISVLVAVHALAVIGSSPTHAQPLTDPPSPVPDTQEPEQEPPAAAATPESTEEPTSLPEPSEPTDQELALEEPEVAESEPLVQRINLQMHGFVSQGFIFTLRNNYLTHSRTNGSFEMAEAGINVTVQPVDNLRIGIQLFARDLGAVGNYDIKLDWFYLDYRFADWFGIRAGRTKIPFGLYNEVNDVDVARVPILLPQSTYPTQNRDFLLSQTGAEIYGRIPLGPGGNLEYRLYAGTIFLEIPSSSSSSSVTLVSLDVPYLVGGRLMWETPLAGLRMGGSAQALRLDSRLLVGGMPVSVDVPAVLWTTSVEYTDGRLLLAAEYGRWHTRRESSDPMLFPETDTTSERTYVMGSYQIASFFHPGAYYSFYAPDVNVRDGRASRQHDIAATLRFDINAYWLVKLEAHYMRGTASVSASLNGGTPTSMLPENWAAFLVRTTGYF